MASKVEQTILQLVVEELRDVPVSLKHRPTLEQAANILEEMASYRSPFNTTGEYLTLDDCTTTVLARRLDRVRRRVRGH